MHPRVSIVIVSFNTRDLLRRSLASVTDNSASVPGTPSTPSSIPFEIIVVDNCSADGSADMVANEFPDVRLVRAGENLGFARATNVGIRASTGAIVLLLNPDTEVIGSAISQLASFLESHPRAGAVAPALLYADGRPQHSAFRFPTLWMTFLDLFPVHHRLLNSHLNGRYPAATSATPFAIDHPLGAAMMIRRDALDNVGLLDEGFFIYCEEVDWSIRAHRGGWDIYCLPGTQVIHHAGQSTGQVKEKMLIELNRSRYRLFVKHYSNAFVRVHRLILRTWIIRESVAARLKARLGKIDGRELEQRLRTYRAIWEM